MERDSERDGEARGCETVCLGRGGGERVRACVDAGEERDRVRYVMHYYIRLCIVVTFHVQSFEPHACIVIEGFGALEMHLLLLLLLLLLLKYAIY